MAGVFGGSFWFGWEDGIGILYILDQKKGNRPKNHIGFRSVLLGFVRFYRCRSCFGVGVCGIRSILAIADVTGLGGIESQVADRRDQTVDAAGDDRQEHISKGSGCIAFRLQRRVVDDNASNPSKKEGQQKACESLILHDSVSFRLCDSLGFVKRKKVRTTEVLRTEKRKLRLLSHKRIGNANAFAHPNQWSLHFCLFHDLGVAKKGMNFPF